MSGVYSGFDAWLVSRRAPNRRCHLRHRSRGVAGSRTTRRARTPGETASFHLGVLEPAPVWNRLPAGGGITVAVFTGADSGNNWRRHFHVRGPYQLDSRASPRRALRPNDSLESWLTFTVCTVQASRPRGRGVTTPFPGPEGAVNTTWRCPMRRQSP